MRAIHAGAAPLALSLAIALSACAGAPALVRDGPFAGPPPPPMPGLFISPFGEPFRGEPGQPWPSADWFIGADDDLDGAVTAEEFAADGRRWFAQLDTDRDGRLNQAELLAYEAGLRELSQGGGPGAETAGDRTMGLGQRRPSNGRRHRGPRGEMRYGIVAEAGFFNLPQPVKSADVNVDQRVTAEEWAAATQRWFLSLDTDRDGRLTQVGLPVTPLQAREGGGR